MSSLFFNTDAAVFFGVTAAPDNGHRDLSQTPEHSVGHESTEGGGVISITTIGNEEHPDNPALWSGLLNSIQGDSPRLGLGRCEERVAQAFCMKVRESRPDFELGVRSMHCM